MATRDQSIVMAAFDSLGFEIVPGDVVGGPVQFKVTDEAINALKGKTLEVDSDASVKVLQ